MSENEIERAQRFESEDDERGSALRFVREVVETRGQPSDEALDEVRNAGYTDEQIIEMAATVALANFTNYMNNFMGTDVDFPVQEPTDGG
jgi:alkylhydroperoxidase family enzyme